MIGAEHSSPSSASTDDTVDANAVVLEPVARPFAIVSENTKMLEKRYPHWDNNLLHNAASRHQASSSSPPPARSSVPNLFNTDYQLSKGESRMLLQKNSELHGVHLSSEESDESMYRVSSASEFFVADEVDESKGSSTSASALKDDLDGGGADGAALFYSEEMTGNERDWIPENINDIDRCAMDQIVQLIKFSSQSHVDFRCYRWKTVFWMLKRRMEVYDCPNMSTYLNWLRKNPDEIESLVDYLLIDRSKFFDHCPAYDSLDQKFLQRLVLERTISFTSDQKSDHEIKIWVAGCSTGEEAYSIGAILDYQLLQFDSKVPVRILATDLKDKCVERARLGVFSQSCSEDVLECTKCSNLLEADLPGVCRVNERVSRMVHFKVHNLLQTDCYPSGFDLISCRNVLLFLSKTWQVKVLRALLRSLKRNGVLFLGQNEYPVISSVQGEFQLKTISTRHSIVQKLSE
eukprot:TRINITY_DN23270_c0_g1_i1.p1 TRINITY_DN23270_c0_g1~~TRINITY_DN23270_c0_g1_i1.p1  ORF type:complete len:462 (+),score=80.73 TRINITY_DN23270_c0_g1_i1:41-1426(+)